MKERLKGVLAAYGRLAVGLYVGLCLLNYVGCLAALHLGLGSGSGASLLGAYLLYKGLMVPRMGVAAVVIPIIARWLRRAPVGEVT